MKLQYVLITTLLACSASAYSADTIKPGLWEMTSQMQGGGEAANAMAKQGMQMGSTAGGAMAVKLCMTQEMIDRNAVAPQDGDCTHTNSTRSGKTMKFSFVCTKPPSSGEGEVTFTSPEAYTSRVVVQTTRRGKPETMDMRNSGRWLGKDCGNIKPMVLPTK